MFLPNTLSKLYDFSDSGAARTNENLSAEHVNIITLDFPSQNRVGQSKSFEFRKGLPPRKGSSTKLASNQTFFSPHSTMSIRPRIWCCTYRQTNYLTYLMHCRVYKTQI
jgi:hypothetical protein